MAKAGIKFTVGSNTFNDATAAMDSFTSPARQLKRHIGELTTVYDQIAPELINRIRNRFNSNFFGEPPMPVLGDKIRKVREARGINSGNPALVGTGALRDSIRRRPGPTKAADGGQREVYVLRIGSTGVPYARAVLEGSIWELAVYERETEDGEFWYLIDYDSIEGGKNSNEQMYTPNTVIFMREEMTPVVLKIPVPARDFMQMLPDDERFITGKVNEYLASMHFGDDSVLATLYG